MSVFDERVFVIALTQRSEDAKRFAQIFDPTWLEKSEYSPILQTIYDFVKKTNESPSFKTIRKILEEKDPGAYSLRYKNVIDNLELIQTDRSEIIFTLDQANNRAITQSFKELIKDENFLLGLEEHSGSETVRKIQTWLSSLSNTSEDRTMNIKQAVEHLIQSTEFLPSNIRIPCGIKAIDEWCGGGLRRRNLGIILAMTGGGKSSILLIMGYKMATVARKNVWIVTNELVMEEVTERALARMRGISVSEIMNDPTIAYKGLDHQWKQNLQDRLYITEYNRETSVDDLEAELEKMKNLYGWKPDVIILDYMERMKPSIAGYRRDSEWNWYGAIAKDLVRLSKRRSLVIWTAAQLNRKSFSESDLTLDMAQASIKHLQEATAVIAMTQVDIPHTDDVALKLKALKMRQSKRTSRPTTVRCDLSKMSITNEEIEEDD